MTKGSNVRFTSLRLTAGIGVLALGSQVIAPATAAPDPGVTDWPQPIVVTTQPVQQQPLGLVLDAQQRATAVYGSLDGTLVATSTRTNGTWGPLVQIAPAVDSREVGGVVASAAGEVSVFTVDYTEEDPGGIVRLIRSTSAGAWQVPQQIAQTKGVAFNLRIATNREGDLVMSWSDEALDGLSADILSRTLVDGALSGVVDIATDLPRAAPASVAIADDGSRVAAWTRQDGEDYQVFVSEAAGGGPWSTPALVADPESSADPPEVAMNGSGDASIVFAARQTADPADLVVVFRADRPAGDLWSAAIQISSADTQTQIPRVIVDEASRVTVGWEEFTPGGRRPVVLRSDLGVLDGGPTELDDVAGSGPLLSVDPAGTVTALWETLDLSRSVRVSRLVEDSWTDPVSIATKRSGGGNSLLAGGYSGAVVVTVDGDLGRQSVGPYAQAPITQLSGPAASLTLARRSTLAWSVEEGWYTLETTDLRVRTIPAQRASGPLRLVGSDIKEFSSGVRLTRGATSCFEAATRDELGDLGPWSSPRCFTTAVDDKSLKADRAWKRKVTGSAYAGGVKTTSRKGATLRLPGARARQVSLLIARSPQSGKATVFLGKRKLGVVSFTGKRASKKIVTLRSLPRVTRGTLRIVVKTQGRPVAVDGVFIAK